MKLRDCIKSVFMYGLASIVAAFAPSAANAALKYEPSNYADDGDRLFDSKMELLAEMKRETGTAIILITHDLGVVAGMADYVVVMYAGRVVEKGTAEEIFHHPMHPYTIGLMKSKPVVGKKVDKLYNIPGNVPNPVSMPDYCYFRDRCEMRCGQCDGEYPPEIKISDTHSVSCYRYLEQGTNMGYPKSVNVEELDG